MAIREAALCVQHKKKRIIEKVKAENSKTKRKFEQCEYKM